MRVWLVDDRSGQDPVGLEALLNQLAARPEAGLSFLAVQPGWPEFMAELRVRRPDVLMVRDAPWLDGPWTVDMLNHGPALLVAGDVPGCERFRALAEEHPISFLPGQPSLESLWLALLGAKASQHRHTQHKTQMARLQQRLDDRIIIERAKGILVQRLGLTEEDAYKRMRVLSRRQRRQIRDIAQSFLDTQSLLVPEGDAFLDAEPGAAVGKPAPQV
jgi:response regulator NasT